LPIQFLNLDMKFNSIQVHLIILLFFICSYTNKVIAQEKPNIFVSTDIGGTDPDDNQSINDTFINVCK
jgi:hypothetical protein